MEDYPLLHMLWTILIIFGFVIWFWLLITVFSDLFRRHDCSGGKKVLWVVFLIGAPMIGVLVYLIANGHSMAERNAKAMQAAQKFGIKGIRVACAGRLGGAEMGRYEWYREGRVPLHTLRADVDFGVGTAFTTYGTCGVKVWVFKGEVMAHDPMAQDKRLAGEQDMEAVLISDVPVSSDSADYWLASTDQVLVTRDAKLLAHPHIIEASQRIAERFAGREIEADGRGRELLLMGDGERRRLADQPGEEPAPGRRRRGHPWRQRAKVHHQADRERPRNSSLLGIQGRQGAGRGDA